jgi:16S rRNA processing protein RimM
MIRQSEVILIGYFYKTHGVNGELAFSYTSNVFDRTKSPYWVLEMEGLLVPFYINSCHIRSNESALVCLDGINDALMAKALVGKQVYYPISYADEAIDDIEEIPELIGYQVVDEFYGVLGNITLVDDSTLNILLIAQGDRGEVMIPVAGDFIKEVDDERKLILVCLPESLIHLQE